MTQQTQESIAFDRHTEAVESLDVQLAQNAEGQQDCLTASGRCKRGRKEEYRLLIQQEYELRRLRAEHLAAAERILDNI